MLWGIFAFLSLATSACLAWPMFSRRHYAPPRVDYDLEVYRVQLSEIERDRTRGLLDDKDAAAAQFEIQRCLLASNENASNDNRQNKSSAIGRIAAVIVIMLALPGASFGVYHYIGAPQMPELEKAAAENQDGDSLMLGNPSNFWFSFWKNGAQGRN